MKIILRQKINIIAGALICLLCWISSVQASDQQGEYLGAIPSERPDWFKNSFLDFEEDVAEAADNGKRVMIYFHQEGCPYCAQLVDENFADEDIKAYMQQHFESIEINMWGDREVVSIGGKTFTEKSFAAALKVQYTPTILFLNEQGSLALRLDGYYPTEAFRAALNYVAEKQESNLSFAAYREQLSNAVTNGELIDEDFFIDSSDLQALAGRDDKPLAVYFERVNCDACQTLHNRILSDDRTRELVVQANNIQLDTQSTEWITTPDGTRITITDWVRNLDVNYQPSVVFFDKSGKEVMRISAFIKTFHFQSVYDYVLEEAYLEQPSFQRYIAARGEKLREAGYDTDIWGYESLH